MHHDAGAHRGGDQVLGLEALDRRLRLRGETNERLQRNKPSEEGCRLEQGPFGLRQRVPDFSIEVSGHLAADGGARVRRERQENRMSFRGLDGPADRDLVAREAFRKEEGLGRLIIEAVDPEDLDSRTFLRLPPGESGRDRTGNEDDLRGSGGGDFKERSEQEPGELGIRVLDVVQHEEDGQVADFEREDAAADRPRVRTVLREDRPETATTQPGQERGEIPQEQGPRRAFVNFVPVDVRPRPLTHEPARDERALPNPRNPGGDEDGGGRTYPGVEDPELLGPPKHTAEAPQRVAPED